MRRAPSGTTTTGISTSSARSMSERSAPRSSRASSSTSPIRSACRISAPGTQRASGLNASLFRPSLARGPPPVPPLG